MPVRLLDIAASSIKRDLYLTDGTRLWRVLAVLDQNVELEDCGDPDGLPEWRTVREIVRGMKLVRPAAGAS